MNRYLSTCVLLLALTACKNAGSNGADNNKEAAAKDSVAASAKPAASRSLQQTINADGFSSKESGTKARSLNRFLLSFRSNLLQ